MAIDWIKMRVDLQSHPKVVRILSAMRPNDVHNKTDKFRVIGGLHAVWSVFDAHCEDGILNGYTPETLDHVIGWDGFSGAMIGVGWLIENNGVSLAMPEFSEHNGQSAKRRAEDQKRKRDSRSSTESVRNLSANDSDKKRTREEKRREEKSNTNTPLPPKGEEATPPFVLPDWIPADAWKAFMETRKAKKAKDTPYALELIVKTMEGIQAAGQDPILALNNSIKSGWSDVYMPKDSFGKQSGKTTPKVYHTISGMNYSEGVTEDGSF